MTTYDILDMITITGFLSLILYLSPFFSYVEMLGCYYCPIYILIY